MKKLISLFLMIFLAFALKAQVVSISPSSAFLSQTITATITLSPGILQAGTPLSVTDIYLEQNGNKIYTDAFSVSQIFPGTPPYTDSLSTNFTIPPGAILGWYDVHVITNAPGPINNVLVNGFLIPAVGSCPVPFNVSGSALSGSTEQINWSPSVIADTFRVRYRLTGTSNYFYKDVDGAGNVSTTVISGLAPGTTYDVDVSTICDGIKSTYSVPVASFTTLSQSVNCAVPFGITIAPVTATTAQVNWSNFVVSDTFRIRYYQTPGNYFYQDVNGGGAHTFTLTNLQPATSYNVQISSICLGVGNGYSPAISFVTLAGQSSCTIPIGTDTSGVTGSTATILWTNSVSADTFRVRYRKQSGGPDLYKNVNGSNYSTLLQNLDPLTTYIYQVSSVCGGSGTGYSTQKTFTTTNTFLPCSTIPFGLSSTPTSNSTATVSWTLLVSADSFLIRYSVNGTTNYLWKKVSGSAGNTATLSGLSPNTTYQWQVRTACNGAPLSSYSVSNIFGTPFRLAQSKNEYSRVLLYPNPVADVLNVEFTGYQEEDILLFIHDATGRKVLSYSLRVRPGENFTTANVSDLAPGVYYLNLVTNKDVTVRRAFIKSY
jgi:hypothetical protein